jgi:hypothetical protein
MIQHTSGHQMLARLQSGNSTMAILCFDRPGPASSGRRSRDDLQPYARIFGTGHTGDKDLARLNVGCELHVFRTNIDTMERALSMG